MLAGIALKSALIDLTEYGYVHVEDIAHALHLLDIVKEECELLCTEFGWVIRFRDR